MGSFGPDFYRRRLATSIEDWNMHKAYPRTFREPLRTKARVWSRLEKHRADAVEHAEIDRESVAAREILSSDPCENGTCPFCLGGSDETDFERTRIAAAQRGAI